MSISRRKKYQVGNFRNEVQRYSESIGNGGNYGESKSAIIGPGNIGSDLMYKIMRSDCLEMSYMVGIVESEGIRRARNLGFETTTEGVERILDKDEIKIVCDATGAKAHAHHAPLLRKAGKIAIDMTPPGGGRALCSALCKPGKPF
jgi:acetaldehyde dehydrogenase (acetylating)